METTIRYRHYWVLWLLWFLRQEQNTDCCHLLEVMKVMGFRWRHKRQVVSTVCVDCCHKCQRKPHPGRSNVRAHDERAQNNRAQVGHKVLQRMRIYGNNADRCCPFMVNLVDKAVNARMMEQPKEEMKDEVLFLHNIIPKVKHGLGYKRYFHMSQWCNLPSCTLAFNVLSRHIPVAIVETNFFN